MYDLIRKEHDIITKINNNLCELKTFLIGNVPEELSQTTKCPECLKDDLITNVSDLEYTLKQLEIITNEIRGGNKNVITS